MQTVEGIRETMMSAIGLSHGLQPCVGLLISEAASVVGRGGQPKSAAALPFRKS